MKNAAIFSFLLLLISCAVKERMGSIDIAYIYDPTQTSIKRKAVSSKDSIHIFLSFFNAHIQEENFMDKSIFTYKITPDYYSSELLASDSLNKNRISYKHRLGVHYVSFSIPSPEKDSCLIVVKRYNTRSHYDDYIDIPYSKNSLWNRYLFLSGADSIPILDHYIHINDSVILKNFTAFETDFVYHYNHPLSPASPPMPTDVVPEVFSVDSLFIVSPKEIIKFKSTGLYTLTNDTSRPERFPFIVVNNKFPMLTNAQEMVEPLVYITNREEYKKLLNSANFKIALDTFWLSIGGSKEYTRKLIKTYYSNVEHANRFFTTDKEGWKTDRGMIYTVFGKPTEVYRINGLEEWTYENIQNNYLTFEFEIKKGMFSETDYVLKRANEHAFYWKSTVDKWRKGIIRK